MNVLKQTPSKNDLCLISADGLKHQFKRVIIVYANRYRFIGRLKSGKLIKGYNKDLTLLDIRN